MTGSIGRIVLISLIAACAAQANAASFDCAKASDTTEKLICADKALGARDTMMAKLYALALKQDDAPRVRDEQRQWLTAVQACRDAGCISAHYDERISQLMDTKGGRAASKVFSRKSGSDEGNLSLYGPVGGLVAVSISAMHYGPNAVQTGAVFADSASGVAQLHNGRGTFGPADCSFTLSRKGDAAWTVKENPKNKCTHAADVVFSGTYRR
ncbi:MAG: hypothetical protein J0H18_12100 [Rhizobiales bacterium]|nr:hypothetical protein [Hyphomicrobiales bacterium]